MRTRRLSLVIVTILAVSLLTIGHSPALRAKEPPRAPELPVLGKWSIEFANGVRENCEIKADGTASVAEPLRSAGGRATLIGKAVLITSDDDRVERWTAVGRRVVVEHWFPASAFPNGTPVVGIGDRAE
jgi:hypothetical protein